MVLILPLVTKPLVIIDVISKPKLNLRQKLLTGLVSPVIDVSVKKDGFPVYVLKCFEILAGQCGS